MRLPDWMRAAAVLALLALPAAAADYYAAPDGTPGGDGSREHPWDLATALKPHPAIKPMDTVWLRKGLYRGNFTSRLRGAPGAPVILRASPGERVVLDGAEDPRRDVLRVEGEWAWYWGLEVINSHPQRTVGTPGSNTGEDRGTGVSVWGPQIKIINCIVRDTGSGIGFMRAAVEGEIYGTMIFNTGWRAPDREHGPGVYTQNKDGWKKIRENIFFNAMRHNMQLYGSDATFLDNYLISGNVNFNGRWLMGGGGPMRNMVFEENYFYRSIAEFGYLNKRNEDLAVRGNYLPWAVWILGWNRIELKGNTVFFPGRGGPALIIESHLPSLLAESKISANTYIVADPAQPVAEVTRIAADQSKATTGYNLKQWQSGFGFDLDAKLVTYARGTPDQPHVFVRRNHFEPDRAHVVIYNWPRRPEVEVDLAPMNPQEGDRWQLKNVQNLAEDGLSGVYDGKALKVRMTGWTAAPPVGETEPVAPVTFPEFGVFVLTLDRARPAASRSGADETLPYGAPGSIVTTHADGIAEGDWVADWSTGADTLGGVSVHLRDSAGQERLARLIAVSPGSVSYAVPDDLASGPATVTLLTAGGRIDGGGLFLRAAAPGLFTLDGKNGGPAAGYARLSGPADSVSVQPLSSCSPEPCRVLPVDVSAAQQDPLVTLFGTAFRHAPPGAQLSAAIGGSPVEFVGVQPDEAYPGLDLIHLRIPKSIPHRGPSPLRVTLDGQASNTVTIGLQ